MQASSASAQKDGPNYHDKVGNLRTGTRNTSTLLLGKEGAPNNYKANFGGGEDSGSGDWVAPRHRHTFEQVRHPLSGDYTIGTDQVLPAGWVAYFPESVYYGPQVKSGNLVMFSLQFGGTSGQGYWSMRQRKDAFQALAAKGTFNDGVYTWVDDKGVRHNQDSAEAVFEQALGRKTEYPPARYKDLVMMNPAAFNWRRDKDQTGVARKHLGTFTERLIKVALIQVEKGATLSFGEEPAPEVLFLKEGVMTHDNTSYDRHSAFSTETDDAPVALRAIEPCELLYIKTPTF